MTTITDFAHGAKTQQTVARLTVVTPEGPSREERQKTKALHLTRLGLGMRRTQIQYEIWVLERQLREIRKEMDKVGAVIDERQGATKL